MEGVKVEKVPDSSGQETEEESTLSSPRGPPTATLSTSSSSVDVDSPLVMPDYGSFPSANIAAAIAASDIINPTSSYNRRILRGRSRSRSEQQDDGSTKRRRGSSKRQQPKRSPLSAEQASALLPSSPRAVKDPSKKSQDAELDESYPCCCLCLDKVKEKLATTWPWSIWWSRRSGANKGKTMGIKYLENVIWKMDQDKSPISRND